MGEPVQAPREAWLRSRSDDVYAAAISECRSGDPSWCSAHEKCRQGDCFVDSFIVSGRRELRHLVAELIVLGHELKKRRHLSIVQNVNGGSDG
jgi:hypothetical protein